MIPKKIHYCWFGGKEYTALIEKCMKTWSEHFPDWEFILWNESNSPLAHPFVSRALKDKKYAFVADYVRCYALYEHGGVYLDTDVEVIKNFDNLLRYNVFLGSECKNVDNYNCAVMGSIKGEDFLYEMLKYYDNSKEYIPIPIIASEIIKKIPHDNYGLFNSDFFYPYNPYDPDQNVKQLFFSDITVHTYAIHHWEFSWKPSLSERIIKYLKRKLLK
ncbi:glycosyltransferase [Acinetobacter johnsonii]|uniref:glycosyltransferase family 32 protein n=1 Tax=Acinetobacter johnsonii TaxID=40214 RepID=UPI00244BCDDF|nr:glycosyltransferase [Acinetobacter johnsonii]MDH1365257.1 glycosyltransferase [Acinetobacter johnsonii]